MSISLGLAETIINKGHCNNQHAQKINNVQQYIDFAGEIVI